MILANRLALHHGKITNPTALSLSFMNAVFNIEINYESEETFAIVQDGKPRFRQLYHLTRADLQLAFILQKCANTLGKIYLHNTLSIWHKLSDYYEDPITVSSFYESMEKFDRLELIRLLKDEDGKLFVVELQHYLIPETGKIGNHIKAHPFFYSRSFTNLSIAEQKLVLSLVLQQGVNKKSNNLTFRMVGIANSENVQYRGLCSFLHGNSTHIRSWIQELLSKSLFENEPLLRQVIFNKKGRSLHQVQLGVHPGLYSMDSDLCHDEIEPPIVYKKKANLLEKFLDLYGIGEVRTCKGGIEFARIVQLIKLLPSEVVQYVVKKLHSALMTRQTAFEWSSNYIRTLLEDKTHTKRVADITKQGIYPYLVYEVEPDHYLEAEKLFFSKLDAFPADQVGDILVRLKDQLIARYSIPIKPLHYTFLEQLPFEGIPFVRAMALKQKREPLAYLKLEHRAQRRFLKALPDETKTTEVMVAWMLSELDKLPRVDLKPYLPPGLAIHMLL